MATLANRCDEIVAMIDDVLAPAPFANVRVTPACDFCQGIAGQRRIVHLDDCPDECDGVHVACNACIRGHGIDPATCTIV